MNTQRGRAWLAVAAIGIGFGALMPPGMIALGAVLGAVTSLLALGIVLAYRAHRFINLSHAALGAVPGSLVAYLVAHHGWNFFLAYPVGIAAGCVLGIAAGMLLGERLADASRTVVLVASLGAAFVLGSAHVALGLATGSVLSYEIPLGVAFEVFPIRFGGTHFFAVLTAAASLAGVWAFLQRSGIGLRVRALAGNARHARRLGTDPHKTWRILWAVLGAVAAAAGIVSQPLLGTTVDSGPLLGPLLLALAAAAVAGMRDLPLAVGACVSLSIAYQSILWRTSVGAYADLMLVAVVTVAFLVRSRGEGLSRRSDPPRHRLVRSPRPLPSTRSTTLFFAGLAAAVMFGVLAWAVLPRLSPGDAQRIGSIAVFAVAGLSVHVTAAYRGSLNLGAWALVGVSSFVAGRAGVDVAGLAAGTIAGVTVALVLGVIASRAGALAHSAVTLASAFAVAAIATRVNFPAADFVELAGMRLDEPAEVSTIAVVALLICVAGVGALRRSKLGRGALALREDRRLAVVHGIRPVLTDMSIDAIGGAIAGLAGVLYLWNVRVIHPDSFGAVRSLEVVALTVVGGIGSVLGPLLGAATIKGSEFFTRGPAYLLATGAGLLVIVVWLRGGLISLAELLRSRPERFEPAPGGADLEVTPRFCPVPVAETRKARRSPIVSHLGVTSLIAGGLAGIAFSMLLEGSVPVVALWSSVILAALVAAGTAVGHLSRTLWPPAITAVIASLAVLVSPMATGLVVATGSVIFGMCLRNAGSSVALPLAHAARGWTVGQAAVGLVLGLVVGSLSSAPEPWLVAASLVLLVAAVVPMQGRPRSAFSPGPGGCALVAEDLAVQVGGSVILEKLHLEMRPGEVVGIVGANGVGKTSFLRCLAGEIEPAQGSVAIRRSDATVLASEERFHLGLALSDAEDGSNGELTVRENLRLASVGAGSGNDDALAVSAASIHNALSDRLDDRAAVLSGGERRLLAVAQMLVVRPDILLVDELSRGLSSREEEIYAGALTSLAASGTAVAVVDHDAERLAKIATRIVRLTPEGFSDQAVAKQPEQVNS